MFLTWILFLSPGLCSVSRPWREEGKGAMGIMTRDSQGTSTLLPMAQPYMHTGPKVSV